RPVKKPLSSAEVFRRVRKSTVIFASVHQHEDSGETHVSPATGYIIDASGLCVTNYHVLEGYADFELNRSMQIRTYDGKAYPVVDILAASKENDIAIVKVGLNGDRLTPLPLGDTAPIGSTVYAVSHPKGMFYYFSDGVVAGNYQNNRHADSLDNGNNFKMLITADYAAGSSGGPIVDAHGNLVGTVSSTRSVYYNPRKQQNLQMVFKNTIPVKALKALIGNK